MEPRIDQANSEASTWGGGALALGALAYVLAVVAYVVLYGQPAGSGAGGEVTLADRVAHLEARWELARPIWFVETAAALLMATAGFVLQARASSAEGRVSARAAWSVVGVGGVLLSLMYAFMLGGYPGAAAAFAEEPALFGVMNDVATFLFNLGSTAVFLGLAGAFAGETGARGALPRGLGIAGTGLALLCAAIAVLMLVGIEAMGAAAPLALVTFLFTAYLGFAIWRRSEPASADAAPARLEADA